MLIKPGQIKPDTQQLPGCPLPRVEAAGLLRTRPAAGTGVRGLRSPSGHLRAVLDPQLPNPLSKIKHVPMPKKAPRNWGLRWSPLSTFGKFSRITRCNFIRCNFIQFTGRFSTPNFTLIGHSPEFVSSRNLLAVRLNCSALTERQILKNNEQNKKTQKISVWLR